MLRKSFERGLAVPERSFFLFGPRGVGKSTWLKSRMKFDLFITLLDNASLLELTHDPSKLKPMTARLKPGAWVCIDEIQKIPKLLDEVHYLIEERELRFALTGSSARKLRRGGANLLAGRALNRSLEQFCSSELGDEFDIGFIL